MINIFLTLWVVYAVFSMTAPMQSSNPSNITTILTFLYVVIAWLTYKISQPLMKKNISTFDGINMNKVSTILSSLCLLTLSGLILHFWDKIAIRGINYTESVAIIRHSWLNSMARYGGDVSSWQSAAGHILSNMFFPLSVITMVLWDRLKIEKYVYFIFSISFMLVYSYSMGSRTVVICWLALIISSFLLSLKINNTFDSGKFYIIISSLLISYIFSSYVFSERIKVWGKNDAKYYYESFSKQLNGKIEYSISDNESGGYGNQMNTLYATHSKFTFDKVIAIEKRTGSAILTPILSLFEKVKIFSKGSTEPRSYSGVFLSLPGCAWYDAGILGVLLFGIVHGLMISFYNNNINKKRHIFMFLMVGLFTILSPISAATNFMSFPFICLSLLTIFLI